MATALAEAGQPDRAEATARGIPDPAVRATALGGVARVLALIGPPMPRGPARRGRADRPWDPVLLCLAAGARQGRRAQAGAGFWERAERTVGDIAAHYAAAGARALRLVAVALAEAGQWERAEATAHGITGGMERAAALAAVGRALLAADHLRGLALLGEAERGVLHSRSISPGDAEPLRAAFRTLLEAGPGWGPAVATALQQLPRRLVPEGQAEVTRMVALALADAGQWGRTGKLTAGISHPGVQAEGRRDLAEAMAVAGQWDDAEWAARDIQLPKVRSEALVAVASSVGVLDRDRGLALAADAEELARQISVGSQDWTWEALAEAQAAVGRWDLAEQTAARIPEPHVRAQALRALAVSLAGAGQWDRAERTALAALAEALALVDRERALAVCHEVAQLAVRAAGVHYPQAESLRSMAVVLAGAGEWDHAERAADAIADHSIAGMSYQAEAFGAVVEALAEAGELGQARRVALGRPDRPGQFRALGTAVKALSRVDRPAALALAAEARRIAGRMERDLLDRSSASRQLAEAWAGLGRWDDAERQLRDITSADERARAALGLVEALGDAGELGRADRVARDLEDPKLRVRARATMLRPAAEADRNRAHDLAGEAEQLARAMGEPYDQADAYLQLATSLTAAATVQRASPDDPLRARAHRVLGVLLAGPTWAEALLPLARLQPSALEAVGRALDQVTPAS